MKINLSGNWKMILDSGKEGENKKFYNAFPGEENLYLPGTVSQQKKSPETSERATGFLTDPYKYEGWLWLNSIISIKLLKGNYRFVLERTRYSTLWINGNKIGSVNTLNGKHIYDFTLDQDEENLCITLKISNVDYIVPGGHMTSSDTQTNWVGVTGEISLEKLEDARLENVMISTEVENSVSYLKLKTDLLGMDNNCQILLEDKNQKIFEENCYLKSGKNEITLKMPQEMKFWSAQNPYLYKLTLKLENAEKNYSYEVGFRSFKANGKFFEINGQKVFLRGKHDGLIFPETGYAPTDVESWIKVLKTAKDYGINHYRFHTCCPPEAAFIAADKVGIYMSPELPFWGTIQAPGEEGFNEEQQNYLINEGYEILNNFGNHPSFVMMSMGNELWGSEKRLDDIMKAYHDYDDRHLYTGGSNNFQFWPRTTEHEDYFVGVRFSQEALIRGSYAQCDAPLGFVQTDEPNTNHNYDIFFENSDNNSNEASSGDKEIEIQFGTGVKKVKTSGVPQHFLPNKPCITHEVGQYCMYPNYEENQRYTGVLKPYNFEEFKKRLENAGLGNKAQDYFRDSSRLAVQCYKTEIEAALRSNEISGFQLLDIQDFTGQGTAVVGILNSFMESKGILEPSQWRSFCDDTVLLASFDKFIYEQNEEFSANIIFHNYSDSDFAGDFITAYLIDSDTNEILCEEQFDIKENIKGNQNLGIFKYCFDKVNKYQKISFVLISNSKESIVNAYTLHVYPQKDKEISELLMNFAAKETVEFGEYILTKSEKVAKESSGKKIIYFPVDFESLQTVPGTYCTDFWCYPMFRSISEGMKKQVPVGTLGLTIQNKDLLLKDFKTDTYTTPKWYNLISHATCVNLGKTNISPVVQMIDNFERNWKLGILYKDGDTLVCTSRLWEIYDKPEVNAFLKSILNNF